MTTIFADAKAGVMVCDSKATLGETWFACTKVFRIENELVGFAGSRSEGLRWVDWYTNGKRGPQPKTQKTELVILGPDGVFYIDGSGELNPIERGYMGIGTGGGYAIAAHMAGMDAECAVEVACQIDANSGGDVVVHTLQE